MFAHGGSLAAGRVLSERLACPILPRTIEGFGQRVILGPTGTDASILTGYIIITLSWDLS